MHHKHFGTKKDPYDRNKGFFYSHIITQILQHNDITKEELKELGVEDLDNDPVVQFQKK